MADDYQSKKGRLSAPNEFPEDVKLAPPPALSDRERARIQGTIEHVKANVPEIVPMIKDLTDAGLIHGWRNVYIK